MRAASAPRRKPSDTAATTSSTFQSVRFDRSLFSPADARRWMRARGFAPIKRVDETPNWLRYRLAEPENFSRFRTMMLMPGVEVVLGWP